MFDGRKIISKYEKLREQIKGKLSNQSLCENLNTGRSLKEDSIENKPKLTQSSLQEQLGLSWDPSGIECPKGFNKFDLTGLLASVLCSLKCLFSGGMLALGGAVSAGSALYQLAHLSHNAWVVLPLVFLSFVSAFQGLLRPMFKLLVKTGRIKNKTAFFIGLSGFSSLLLILGGQLFSSLILISLPGLASEQASSAFYYGHHSDHMGHHAGMHDLPAIIYEQGGPLGLSEHTFIALLGSFSHTLFFLSSLSLGALHFSKIFVNGKRK